MHAHGFAPPCKPLAIRDVAPAIELLSGRNRCSRGAPLHYPACPPHIQNAIDWSTVALAGWPRSIAGINSGWICRYRLDGQEHPLPPGSRSRPYGMCEGCHPCVRSEQGQRGPAGCRVTMVRTSAFMIVRRIRGLVSGIPYPAGHQRPRLAGPCVKDRKSGEWRTTPVASRGETQWVRNPRSVGTGELRVGKRRELPRPRTQRR